VIAGTFLVLVGIPIAIIVFVILLLKRKKRD
jgi:LPXTG-motif cell wall-anchored protein